MRDELGRLYVGHTGRVGGGQPGISQRAFRKFAQDLEWQEIATSKRPRKVVVFGPFQNPALLLDGLARYVHTVARFKGSYLRSVVFAPVLAQVKMRAGDLRNVKRFPRTGIEAWLKVEVVAALGERVRKLCTKGFDLLLDDGTDAGTGLELKAATDFNIISFLDPLQKYGVPCLFLGDGTLYKSFPTSGYDDFEVIGYEVFSDGAEQWVLGLVSPGRSQDQSRPHPGRRGVRSSSLSLAMLRDQLRHGFPEAAWNAAKEEARRVLIDRARVRGMIPYSELANQITSIEIGAHDPRLFHMIGDISIEEDAAGRGMLSALVVHKHGDMQPGPGFFELAKRLGRDTEDILECWVAEMRKVHAVWSKSAR